MRTNRMSADLARDNACIYFPSIRSGLYRSGFSGSLMAIGRRYIPQAMTSPLKIAYAVLDIFTHAIRQNEMIRYRNGKTGRAEYNNIGLWAVRSGI